MNKQNRKKVINVGDIFGDWLVIGKSPSSIGRGYHQYYECSCSCGNKCHVRSDSLTSKKSKSCGCDYARGVHKYVGMKFDRWTITGIGRMNDQSHRHMSCVCDCGTKRDVRFGDLLNGRSKSCGCLRDEKQKILRKGVRKVEINGKKYFPWSDNFKNRFEKMQKTPKLGDSQLSS